MNDIPQDTSRPIQPEQDIASHPLSDQLARQQSQVQGEPEASAQYALDLYQVASLFDEAGLPRNRRSLSRYCTVGKLDCEKVETLNGEEWRVDELSVHRLTAQIQEQQKLTHTSVTHMSVSVPDTARQVAPSHPTEKLDFTGKTSAGQTSLSQTMPDISSPVPQEIAQQPTNGMTGHSQTADDLSTPDQSVPTSAGEEQKQEKISTEQVSKMGERLIIQMERENDLLRDQLERKDNQIENKDKQIDDLIERGREDKMLIQNFQRKLGMLNAPKEDRPVQQQPAQNYHHPDQNSLPWQGSQQNENSRPDWSVEDKSVDNSWGMK